MMKPLSADNVAVVKALMRHQYMSLVCHNLSLEDGAEWQPHQVRRMVDTAEERLGIQLFWRPKASSEPWVPAVSEELLDAASRIAVLAQHFDSSGGVRLQKDPL